eukprot:TRINITY_DN14199_c0_g1_i1.p1 TRINITY_DN14199_c0_g1~~TRINITY_DN14199_c0_g1_i1.p1  ORF type:complete len:330 (-),score=66.10 TRINITY_DN14199_c0_g1_i1:848-1837(-)
MRTLAFLRQLRGLKVVDMLEINEVLAPERRTLDEWLAAWRTVGATLGAYCSALTTMKAHGSSMAAFRGLLADPATGQPATDPKRRRQNTSLVQDGAAGGAARALRQLRLEPDLWGSGKLALSLGGPPLPSLKELKVVVRENAILSVDDAAAIATSFPGLARLALFANTQAGVGRALRAAAKLTDLSVSLESSYGHGVGTAEVAALLRGRTWERLTVGSYYLFNVNKDVGLENKRSLDVVAALRGVAAFPHALDLSKSFLQATDFRALLTHPTAPEWLRELVLPDRAELDAITVPLGHLPQLSKLHLTLRVVKIDDASPPPSLWKGLPSL